MNNGKKEINKESLPPSEEILNFSMYCRHEQILAPLKSRAGGVSTPRDVNGVISCD
jgi:hypothetical protein